MGNEFKITRWTEAIKKLIKSSRGIDYDGLSLYTIEFWGFSDGLLKKYLDKLESKGFIKKDNEKYVWVE